MTSNDLNLLKQGKPPTSDHLIQELTVLNPWIINMKEYCINQVISNGGCKVKVVHGDSGTGKSHYLNYLRLFSEKEMFYSVLFDISSTEFQIINIIELYKVIVSKLDFEKLKKSLLIKMLTHLGYDLETYNLHPHGLCDFICEFESAPVYTAKQSIRRCINEIIKNLDISFSYRLFLMRLMDAISTNDETSLNILQKWFSGDKLNAFEKRQCQLFEPLNKQNARIWLYSFSEVIKLIGYKGLILIFDQFEAVLPQFESTVKYTNLKRNDVYEMIRQLIDDLDFLKNFLLIISGNSEIVYDEKNGLQSYHALWMRIQQNYKQDEIFNPYADLINSNLIMEQLAKDDKLQYLADKLDELFAKGEFELQDLIEDEKHFYNDFQTTIFKQTSKYIHKAENE